MKYSIYAISFLLLLASCSGRHDPPPEPRAPLAAKLTFPAQNTVCVSGNVISASQSTVQFKWNAAKHADSYDITIKNLVSGDTLKQSTAGTQVTVTLLRGTPFSWYITSKSSKVTATAKSDTWKFYNAGDGIVSYAPFPAELNPDMGAFVNVSSTGFIKLSWQSSDVDNDIVDYDIYFGTTASPPLYKKNNTSLSLEDVPATAKTKYYWKVVIRDSRNNTSTSDVIQFNTN